MAFEALQVAVVDATVGAGFRDRHAGRDDGSKLGSENDAAVKRFITIVMRTDDGSGAVRSRAHDRARTGSVTVNRLPEPGSLSTVIVPPCCSTIVCVIARPSPVPAPTSFVV